jgi:hypothetical protein
MPTEIEAMKVLEDALESLEAGARGRVLQWAFSRFNGSQATNNRGILAPALGASVDGQGVSTSYETFAELFDAVAPTIEKDKALAAAYWVQICLNQPSFQSQMLNTELKDLGHGIGNITEALTQLKDERPALILQLKKSGLTKQARKTYKLTSEGVKRIQLMARKAIDENESD